MYLFFFRFLYRYLYFYIVIHADIYATKLIISFNFVILIFRKTVKQRQFYFNLKLNNIFYKFAIHYFFGA